MDPRDEVLDREPVSAFGSHDADRHVASFAFHNASRARNEEVWRSLDQQGHRHSVDPVA
ncbi:hypothetical protein AB0M36_16490 [Actinoplanes sp. NPDC051346]|uniref:hypothetical protein n=1 Tax=Actinoplanes sp. NPDC051346 TaxID=3155048 RepID=UPI00342CD56F